MLARRLGRRASSAASASAPGRALAQGASLLPSWLKGLLPLPPPPPPPLPPAAVPPLRPFGAGRCVPLFLPRSPLLSPPLFSPLIVGRSRCRRLRRLAPAAGSPWHLKGERRREGRRPPQRPTRPEKLSCVPSAFCLLPSAFCLLPSAFCRTAGCIQCRGLLLISGSSAPCRRIRLRGPRPAPLFRIRERSSLFGGLRPESSLLPRSSLPLPCSFRRAAAPRA